ncbi:hypothetical protein [Clostridium sp.]|uniref:hypothetical protein n=1 Tax=Clostridium sp. TaxID=1506 RepID=UPI003D6D37D9
METSNYKISKEEGLDIVTSKVKITYDSERNIEGKDYHVYTMDGDGQPFVEYAYFVDVNSGELLKCHRATMSISSIE